MSLFRKLFPKAQELTDAKSRIGTLEADRAELEKRHATLWESYNALDKEVQKERAKKAELEKKLRKQNDADLLLVSMQIQKRIVDGERRETSPVLAQLYAQQQSLSSNYNYGYQQQYGGHAQDYLGLGFLGGAFR